MSEDGQRIQKALDDLLEHYDSVQIFTSRYEGSEDGTVSFQKGVGNWYARRGQVAEWLTRQDEDARIEARKKDDQ